MEWTRFKVKGKLYLLFMSSEIVLRKGTEAAEGEFNRKKYIKVGVLGGAFLIRWSEIQLRNLLNKMLQAKYK